MTSKESNRSQGGIRLVMKWREGNGGQGDGGKDLTLEKAKITSKNFAEREWSPSVQFYCPDPVICA